MEQEVGPDPLGVRDVGENFVREQLGEDGCTLGTTGGTESAAFTGERHQELGPTLWAKDAGEAGTRRVHNRGSRRRRNPRRLARSRIVARIALPRGA